jgi:Flp pilus assembly protein TadB
MPDPLPLALGAAAGGCASVMALALLLPARLPGAREWLARRDGAPSGASLTQLARRASGSAAYASLRSGLALRLQRAGRGEAPEAAGALGGLLALGSGGAAAVAVTLFSDPLSGLIVGAAVAVAVVALLGHRLVRAAQARRELLLGQLGPILELVSLELSGGAPPMLALEAVLGRARSELATAMRAQLIGSRVAGSASFDGRLAMLGDRLGLSALHSMAMILGLSRDYGSGVGQGIRALAADLRRARRRRVIELSRGALNRVLVPAAVGVLLPFMAILLFPAIAVLMRSLR